MARRLFGTDGIRGRANQYPMTCEIATALGRAVVHYFETNFPRKHKPLIIVGKDTRRSCYMLEQAFSAGVCSQGGRVILTGPLPTPGVAFVTHSMRADAGVMISASHNPYYDNGIKIFDRHGFKLPDEVEEELEELVLNPNLIALKQNEHLGNAKRLDEVIGRYIVHTKSILDENIDLTGTKVVLDCANGAAYKVGPLILSELGIDVFPIGIEPNGLNINEDVGSLHPEAGQIALKKHKANLGILLDGDADRLILIDEKGEVIEGDQVIALIAKRMVDQGHLKKGDTVVGTVMSNLGLQRYVEALGLNFERTKVGDRYIIEKMIEKKSILGGEPSGHIILKQFSTTGDGILGALKVLECIQFYQQPLSQLVKDILLYPQMIKNIKVLTKPPLEANQNIQKAIKKAESVLGLKGRVLLRYSGTEDLARIMVEAEDDELMKKMMNDLENVVEKELT
jgi:phosphoglucosamine mutase